MGVHQVSRAVFLDRDGVINRSVVRKGRPYPPSTVAELEIFPGVREALCRLRSAGFHLIVVSNQPDVARGTQTRACVEQINARLQDQLPLDEIRICYHDDADNCDCRKPRPGLLLQAAREFNVDLAASFMVGDRWCDIEAGHLAGCKTLFVDHGYDEPQPKLPDARVKSLAEATDWILLQANRRD